MYFDYEFREKIYKKNGIQVIVVNVYIGKRKWKNHLIKRIIELKESLKESLKML